ncbi:MAG: putative 4-hydroxybenzoate polyprenyltransferase [Bacteroidales bacterium]|nr:putative 4-hydroxybenzoate polyprenyltransferase [Bacteroidales bacterium]
MTSISKYLSLVKFSHTIFALPFAIIGFFLAVQYAHYQLNWQVFIMVLLCMAFARNAAMGFNRYVDRNIDKINPRTAIREIPAGKIKAKSALFFVAINSILFIATTWFINQLVFFLSPIALLVVLGYSYTKRFTFLCHFILGLGLSLAPIGAYLSVTGEFALVPLLFSFIVLFWTSGFDIIYALQDNDFDKENNLFSVPAWLGKKKALMVSSLVHLIAAALILYAGYSARFGLWYWIGAFIFIGLLIYQHSIVKPNDLSKVNLAFFTTNGVASVLFACFTVLSLFL